MRGVNGMNNAGAYWLWYPGDLERYHAMKQNFSRVERGCPWPAFWKSDGFRQRVVFRRTYQLAEETECTVYGNPGTVGHVVAGERKVPFGTPFTCGPGEVRLGWGRHRPRASAGPGRAIVRPVRLRSAHM